MARTNPQESCCAKLSNLFWFVGTPNGTSAVNNNENNKQQTASDNEMSVRAKVDYSFDKR